MSYLVEVILILILIALNGLFAMSEFAIVSARKTRLQQRAEKGDAGAAVALEIASEPTQFLSTIQIGITLIGIVAGAIGGIAVANGLAGYFTEIPVLAPYAGALSMTLVVLVITYLSLVFGELVPKRLALNNAEAIATTVARPMKILSRVAAPLVFILSGSTDAVLRLSHTRPSSEPPVTEEEVKILLEAGTEAGVFEEAERSMVEGIFELGDLRVGSLMTPRPDIIALDLDDSDEENLKKMILSGRSNLPAYQGKLDTIAGMVSAKAVLARMVEGGPPDIRASLGKPTFVPETLPVLKLLEQFRQSGVHIALVTDEYGSIQGIVSLHDILEAIVGDVPSFGEPVEAPIVAREDGSWLVDGSTPVDDVRDVVSVGFFPGEEEGHYRTLAGLLMFLLNRIPVTGDHVESTGLRFEVVDMDGKRVDKVLVMRTPAEESGGGPG